MEIRKKPPRLAFYAPLKPPDHPIPSGDRQMARMLLSALNKAGYEAFLASRYISYSKRHGLEHLAAKREGAQAEARRLLQLWEIEGGAPQGWFCYHPYDKSPDWLGMEICTALDIPMITAEPCKTGQGLNGEWLPWRAEAQRGIRMASMNIVMTHSDLDYLEGFIASDHIAWMEPFIDADLLEVTPLAHDPWEGHAGVRLLTVGMMRPGAKLDSYAVLSQALALVTDLDWHLVIAGGGPGEEQVRAMMQPLGSERVTFAGELKPGEAQHLMREADLLAWPGCREAYGMVYLEAAHYGTPSIGLDNMGVPLVVRHDRTGLLATPADVETYASCLRRAISDDDLRNRLSLGASDHAANRRSADYAASRMREILAPILHAGPAA
ncbi:MAG: glycosyltransferase family 4 protein [Rhizobiaceae bacterium]